MNIFQRMYYILGSGILIFFLFLASPSEGSAPRDNVNYVSGMASWYSEKDPFIHQLTASGEVFDDSKKTCASWDYDFGVRLKVINKENGKSVVCVVNDRGPSKKLDTRILDLSKSAFRKIANLKRGLIHVTLIALPNDPTNNL